MKIYVVLYHWGDSNEHTTYHYIIEDRKDIQELFPFASWPGAMNKSQGLDQPMSRTKVHGPKNVRAIDVRLHLVTL